MKAFLRITDHAVLRYLQRVKGIDVEQSRAEIAEIVCGQLKLGDTSVEIDGVKYILDGASIVTVLGPCMRRKNQKAKRPASAQQEVAE